MSVEAANPTSPPTAPRKRGCFFYGAIALVLSALIFVGGIFAALWWIQRPVKPVELSEGEKQEIQAKVEQVQQPENRYQAGDKVVTFTERELNGLLNEHTDLGETLKFEVDADALNAYISYRMPEDSLMLPGKMIKGRARLEVIFDKQDPQLKIQDVTVYGISVPNAWIGGLKDRNLARELFGRDAGSPFLQGVKDPWR